MQYKRVIFLIVVLFFITSCASSEKPMIKSDREMVTSLKDECTAQNKVLMYDPVTKKSSCKEGLADAGKRCTKTIDCIGYCEGSNESTSSGKCSAVNKIHGCVLIIERGERFERCVE